MLLLQVQDELVVETMVGAANDVELSCGSTPGRGRVDGGAWVGATDGLQFGATSGLVDDAICNCRTTRPNGPVVVDSLDDGGDSSAVFGFGKSLNTLTLPFTASHSDLALNNSDDDAMLPFLLYVYSPLKA